MNRENLETFLSVVKTHSFTKTAETMFISQSAVSNRLLALEKELGVHLIDRRAGQRRIELTKQGVEFTEYARRYIDLEQQVRDWKSGSGAVELRVASVVSLTEYILKDFFYRLLMSRNLSVTLSTHWTDRIIAMLENREADVGLAPRVFYSKSVAATPIFDEPLYLVSNCRASDYPEQVRTKDLRRADEIYFDWGLSFAEWHDRELNPFELPLAVTDTTQIIPELLQLPGSFSIIPRGLFEHYNIPQLRLSRLSPAPPNRTCYFLRLKEPFADKLPAIEQFEREFRAYIQGVRNIVIR